jgi:hypothetical protein
LGRPLGWLTGRITDTRIWIRINFENAELYIDMRIWLRIDLETCGSGLGLILRMQNYRNAVMD